MTKKNTPDGNEKTGVKREFVEWLALPETMRVPKTHGEFAVLHKVRAATLSEWKRDPKIWEEVNALVRINSQDKLANVMLAVYQGVIKNKRAAEAELWLHWATGYERKLGQVETPGLTSEVEKLRGSLKRMIEAVKAAGKK